MRKEVVKIAHLPPYGPMVQHKSRFKNYLIDPGQLCQESAEIGEFLQNLKGSFLVPAERALLFVLIYLNQRKGDAWIMSSGKKASWSCHPPHDEPVMSSLCESFPCLRSFVNVRFLLDVAVEYRPRLLPQAIFDVLWNWGQGTYDLLLWDRIPTPFEMLDYQSQGKRIVTMDLEKAMRGELVDGQRDAFEFLLHDLLHADLFFKDAEGHQQQKSFFNELKNIIVREQFLEIADDIFLKDLAYLMSDMNSHRAHLEAQFKAILIQWRLRQEKKSPKAALSVQGLHWVEQVTV